MKKLIVVLSLCLIFTLSIFPAQITNSSETKQVSAVENNLQMKRDVTRGVVIHNDAGSISGSQYRYLESYSTDQLARGFAHYYVAKDDVYQFWDDSKVAWHTGNFAGNTEYIGIEVTNSYGPEYKFRENEEEVFKLTANLLKKYNLEPNRDTVRLHREFRATACPHRSWALHGGSVNAVKDYFIEQIKKYMAPSYNKGNIEKLEIIGNQINIRGWHASSEANENSLRYMFILEAGSVNELARFPISNEIRTDIAAAFPYMKNAKTSGFNVRVPITPAMIGKNIYVVTRFLPRTDANESLADIWFRGNHLKVQVPISKTPLISYQANVKAIGWQPFATNGKTAGTTQKNLGIESLRINLTNLPVKGGIQYTTYVQNIGWQAPVANNQVAGTLGKKLNIEGLKIQLTGDISTQYDVYYRVNIQKHGWLDWAKNGEAAGSTGKALQMEALEVKLVKKGEKLVSTGNAFIK